MRESVVVFAVLATFLVITFVTYARLPPEETYNVTRSGLAGGASRTLVELSYPTALAMLPILGLCAARLRRPRAYLLAVVGAALCATVALVVDPDDLDARAGNAFPAVGVVLALGLTAWALHEGGLGVKAPALAADRLRVVVAAVAIVLSIPWLFAELGFYAPDPVLADEIPAGRELPAVHLGSHHGMEGVVLLLSALLLSRALPTMSGRLTAVTSAAVALMLAYGSAIAAEDFWHEQVAKRGTVDWQLPNMVLPSLGWGWLGIVLAAGAIELLWFRRER